MADSFSVLEKFWPVMQEPERALVRIGLQLELMAQVEIGAAGRNHRPIAGLATQLADAFER